MSYTFNTKTYNTLKTATVSTTDVLETKTPTLPHTNEVGLKQVALSSSIKKGKKICHRAKHNRKPLQSNLEKKAGSCGNGAVLVVLLETCSINHLVYSCLSLICMIK